MGGGGGEEGGGGPLVLGSHLVFPQLLREVRSRYHLSRSKQHQHQQ